METSTTTNKRQQFAYQLKREGQNCRNSLKSWSNPNNLPLVSIFWGPNCELAWLLCTHGKGRNRSDGVRLGLAVQIA